MDVNVDPTQWAIRRETEGWHILSVADHFYTTTRPFPHVWVTAAAIASATTRAKITTSFVNNLIRSPVEVAQAALQMQNVSHGRFELGLGAGWARDEIVGAGLDFPEPRDRAGAFIESIKIVRELLWKGRCNFNGRYYNVDTKELGPLSETPPPLIASVGGARTTRGVTAHVDRVEIKASSPSTRDGALNLKVLADIPTSHLADMIAKVREIDPDIEIGMFVLCNASNDYYTQELQEIMGNNLYGRFFGPPKQVVEGLEWLKEQGVTRAQLSPFDDSSFDRLAPLLL